MKRSRSITDLGIVGLGKMGANMVERLIRGGQRVVGYDRDSAVVARVASSGVQNADCIAALAGKLPTPSVIWMMVPACAPVDETILALAPHLSQGDTLVDGGNGNYKEKTRWAGQSN